MTSDEARERFDAALDGELDEAEVTAFEQALASDRELALEYAAYQRMLNDAALLAGDAPSIDLLSGVQQKLRERSGGRFYRDEFSRTRGRSKALFWMLALSAVVVLAAGTWLAFVTFSH